MKLFLLLVLISLQFFERFLHEGTVGSRISPADFLLVGLGMYYLLSPKKEPVILAYSCATVIIIAAANLYNGLSILTTALISVPSRFLVSGIVLQALSDPSSRRYSRILIKPFSLLLVCSIMFFSDGFSYLTIMEVLNRNEAGIFLIVFLIFWIIFLRPSLTHALITIFALLLFFLLSGSRQLVLSLLASLFVFSILNIYQRGRGKIFSKVATFGMLGAALLIAGQYSSFVDDEYQSRRYDLLTSFEPTTYSDIKRVDNVLFALENFSESPIFGHGLGSFMQDRGLGIVAHSGVVTTLYEFGAIGMIFLLGLYVSILKPIRYSMTRNRVDILYVLAASLLIGSIVQTFFIEIYAKLTIPFTLGIAIYLRKVAIYSRKIIRHP